MPSRLEEERLQDILDEADFLARAIGDRDEAHLRSDATLQRAVLYSLQTIGEAAGLLSEETRAAMPSVPWAKIRGLRNRIVHAYFGIDLGAVWLTAVRDVPAFAKALKIFRDG